MEALAYIVGTAMVPVSRYYDKGIVELGSEALDAAISEAKTDVDVLIVASATTELVFNQQSLGSYILRYLGLRGYSIRVEAGDGSGGAAIATAVDLLRRHRCVAVLGVDKPVDVTTSNQILLQSAPLSSEYEQFFGIAPHAIAAIMAKAYMARHEVKYEDIVLWGVEMHERGAKNPYAYLRKRVTVEEALNSDLVSDPLRLYDVAPLGDGAAAVVLCRDRQAGEPIAKLIGIYVDGEPSMVHEWEDTTILPATHRLSKPLSRHLDKLTHVELHDPFSIVGIVVLESLGLARRGLGARSLQMVKQRINESGGLKSRGNVLGATGVYKLVEIVWELTGREPFKGGGEVGAVHDMSGFDRMSSLILVSL